MTGSGEDMMAFLVVMTVFRCVKNSNLGMRISIMLKMKT